MSEEVPYRLIMTLIVIAFIVGYVVNFMFKTPKYNRVDEGFYGGVAVGAGHPDCLRTLPESSQVLDILSSQLNMSVSEHSSDYKELELLFSKMACLKKDLLSPSGIVDATRYQAFETAHDRIAVAELCGMCMSHNIASRDLDIVFSTWRDRGRALIQKLSTAGNLKEHEVVQVEKLFGKSYEDVYDIATSRCLKNDLNKPNEGDVSGYLPENLKDQREYTNKYGNLSASGWNGAV